jgi:glycosyltransferase involved in cell wall biosynthesis
MAFGNEPLAASSGRGPASPRIGYVVIARDGGERLARSLRSVLALAGPVIYADSGSTDGSPEAAERLGATVVRLDQSAPHTAARGRNAGFELLMVRHPALEFVQFVDGDTEIIPEWPARAAVALDADPRLSLVCGRLRERSRDEHVYGRLFDIEWDGPIGEIRSSGGNAMIRVRPFRELGGFNVAMPGGEEADLCARLRLAGHRVVRLDVPMGVHDSGISRFSQWWSRSARVGRSWANTGFRDVRPGPFGRYRPLGSSLLWAVALPLLAVAGAIAANWYPIALIAPLVVAAGYAILLWRIYRGARRTGRNPADARLYSLFCLAAKWPQLAGMLCFWVRG